MGENNPKSKLTEDDVKTIRVKARKIKNREIDMKMNSLAKEYNIHPATLSGIVSGKTWSHVPREGM